MFLNMFKHKDIRKKILFTLGMLFVFRLGAGIAAPLVDTAKITESVGQDSILGMMNLLGGGALEKFSIFALGVGPYITASIIIQLLSMDVIPPLTEMAKSGAQGRIQLDRITRYLTLGLAFLQAYFMTMAFDVSNQVILGGGSISKYLFISTILTAGTMFLMWVGDQITSKGVGNGISMLIFAGIVSNLPAGFVQVFKSMVDTTSNQATFNGVLAFLFYVAFYLLIIVLVIFTQEAVRKIPIQYTSSSNMKKMSETTFLPIKINSAGVIPVIFASAVLQAPLTIASFFEANAFTEFLNKYLGRTSWAFIVVYLILVVAFTFFYSNLQVDPEKVAENLSKSGAYIPGIRPGKETQEYVTKVLNRLTVLGAIFLCFIAGLPYILPKFVNLPATSGLQLGGTGMIIVVGVALETVKQIEGQMAHRKYQGFARK